jgi:steroid 5-alpha reductase family enzyme
MGLSYTPDAVHNEYHVLRTEHRVREGTSTKVGLHDSEQVASLHGFSPVLRNTMVRDFSPISALLLVIVAFERIIQPILVFPPKFTEFYDAYIGLNPMISSFFCAILTILVQAPFVLMSRYPARISECAFPFIVAILGTLYVVHAPLSSDNATGGLPDKRLSLMASLVLLWAFAYTRSAIADGRYSATYTDSTAASVRKKTGWILTILLSLFITGVRSFIAFFLVSPLSFAWDTRGRDLSMTDVVLAIMFIACVVLKYVASFYCRSMQTSNPACVTPMSGPYTGLRFLDILAELATWTCFLAFAIHDSGKPLPWPVVGVASDGLVLVLYFASACRCEGYPSNSRTTFRATSTFPFIFERPRSTESCTEIAVRAEQKKRI